MCTGRTGTHTEARANTHPAAAAFHRKAHHAKRQAAGLQMASAVAVTPPHTTTSTRWYWVPALDVSAPAGSAKTALIDSPGFQEFGLHHIEPTRLADCMPDLRAHVGGCKFYNCTHLHEPGCGVLDAVKNGPSAGGISASRYKIYSDLFAELSQKRY